MIPKRRNNEKRIFTQRSVNCGLMAGAALKRFKILHIKNHRPSRYFGMEEGILFIFSGNQIR
jgi:hypothetical protein